MRPRYDDRMQYYEELGRICAVIDKVRDNEASVMFREYRLELEAELFALENPHMVHYAKRR